MKTKVIGLIVGAGIAGSMLYACSQPNPPPPCNVGHGDYAAKYIKQSGTGVCADLRGEAYGVDKYYSLDGGVSRVALQPAHATENVPQSDTDTLYTIADLAGEFPENDYCALANGNKINAQVEPEAIEFDLLEDGGIPLDAGFDPAGTGGTIETDPTEGTGTFTPNPEPFSYEFKDTRFFVIPSAPSAQQFESTLTYTDTTAGCTATYKVIGMYPAVACTTDVDCDPNADYDAGRLFGSGINDQFDTFCDTETGLCQLKANEIGPSTFKSK